MKTFAALVALTLAAAPEKPTAKSWREHPLILEVRALVSDVDAGVAGKGWSKRDHDTLCAGLPSTATLWSDPDKHPRRLVTEFGSGDSMYTVAATYDAKGTLRFVYVKAGAVNGSHIEQRTWFDDAGAVLWQRDELLHGPGYTWWRYDPKTKLLADAEAAFRRDGCLGE